MGGRDCDPAVDHLRPGRRLTIVRGPVNVGSVAVSAKGQCASATRARRCCAVPWTMAPPDNRWRGVDAGRVAAGLEDGVHLRLQSCAGARPLNFTVS